MSQTTAALRLGLVQSTSGPDPELNLAHLEGLVSKLAGRCDLAVIPEYGLCLGDFSTVRARALSPADAVAAGVRLAKAAAAPVLLGGVAVRQEQAIFNRSLVVAPDGQVLAEYDKIHLFQLDSHQCPDQIVDERQCFSAGATPRAFGLGTWSIGLSVCYDLRFPELYRSLAPVDLFICTAAFTAATGRAHWEVLLRARAIENQCFVVGAGLCGRNPETGLELHGHSLVAGPWGEVLWQAGTAPSVGVVTLAHDQLNAVRRRLPALAGRRLAAGGN